MAENPSFGLLCQTSTENKVAAVVPNGGPSLGDRQLPRKEGTAAEPAAATN